jgi:hypothetical protein
MRQSIRLEEEDGSIIGGGMPRTCSSARISPAAPLYCLCCSIRRRHSSCRARQGRHKAYCEAATSTP